MLVKFNSRGKGGGSGPIDYLLGKDRKRDKAHVLRGDVDQTKQLIDSLSFARNYTSGTLSFSEENIPDHQKQALMDEYQKMLLSGLDGDQYDVLWVEHRDKDRLELNFLIPNVELGTGKRLQPYYDKVDRDRVNSWQQTVNDRYGFTDPHDPQNKRYAVTAHDLPKDKKQVVEVVTRSLVNVVNQGAIKNRADVINELKANGFQIARETKSSISLKDPSGGKNIRLQGALYERDFKFSEEIRGTIEQTNREYQEQRKQRLSAARDTLNQTYKAKCKYNTERYPRSKQAGPRSNTASNIQSLADLYHGNDIRSSIDSNRAIHTTKIKNNDINDIDEEVKDNVRHKSSISTVIETLVRAVRVAVRRSNRASESISRADNFAHRNKINQFKQRQLKQVKRNVNDRTKTLSM
jgi:hypothetical protein